jgi:hypothetical protein
MNLGVWEEDVVDLGDDHKGRIESPRREGEDATDHQELAS